MVLTRRVRELARDGLVRTYVAAVPPRATCAITTSASP